MPHGSLIESCESTICHNYLNHPLKAKTYAVHAKGTTLGGRSTIHYCRCIEVRHEMKQICRYKSKLAIPHHWPPVERDQTNGNIVDAKHRQVSKNGYLWVLKYSQKQSLSILCLRDCTGAELLLVWEWCEPATQKAPWQLPHEKQGQHCTVVGFESYSYLPSNMLWTHHTKSQSHTMH